MIKYNILHNFISPITGSIQARPGYVLIGGFDGIARSSSALIDLNLKLIYLRQRFNKLASADIVIGQPNSQLPNAQVLAKMPSGFMHSTTVTGKVSTRLITNNDITLTKYHLFIGDDDHKAAEQLKFHFRNMQPLYLSTPSAGSLLAGAEYINNLTGFLAGSGDEFDSFVGKLGEIKDEILSGNILGLFGELGNIYDFFSNNGFVDIVSGLFGTGDKILKGQIYRAHQSGNGEIVASDDLSNLENKVDEIETELGDLTNEVNNNTNTNNQQIQNINQQISQIQNYLQQLSQFLQQKFDNITSTVNQVIDTFNDFSNYAQNAINNLNNLVNNVITTLGSLIATLSGVIAGFGALSGIVSGLQGAFANFVSIFNNLQNYVNQIDNRLSNVENTVSNHSNLISSILAQLASQAANIAGLLAYVNQQVQRLDYRIDNINLSNIKISGPFNMQGNTIINVKSDITNSNSAATNGDVITTATAIVTGAIGALKIDGTVQGGPPAIDGTIDVTIGKDVSFNNHRAANIAAIPLHSRDAISTVCALSFFSNKMRLAWRIQ